ncbi:MAG: alanine racemase [Melioribacteraceae bacterium]|nr:alanine racemase [Melioribacteraceae bacterium]
MLHTSFIELNKQALNSNIRYLKSLAKKDTRYSMVIKANAYGHGIEDILPLIEECGVDHFSVFSVSEAMRAQKVKRKNCDLMIMGWLDKDQMEWAIENKVSFFVFTLERMRAACEVAERMKMPARIHIELETGMHRTGFYRDELKEVVQIIKENRECFEVKGVCTHYAGAEDLANYDRIKRQIRNFNDSCSWIREQGIHPEYRHSACSAALLNYPETAMDLIRIGISSYGFWPNTETKMLNLEDQDDSGDPLEQVLSWKSVVMSIKEVAKNEYVSYGKSFLTNRTTYIATVPVGYGYGFSRRLSNNGHVLIQGKRVPVMGAVNMNMMVVDVIDLDSVELGDEVVLIGKQGDLSISVSSFSNMNNSMNYELLSRLPQHIPRKVVK